MPTSKIILLLATLLAGLVAFSVTLYIKSDTPKSAQENTKALIGGPFSLIDHHGKKVTDADFKGKYMLVYFGYTYCPDICPTELQIMADALDRVPASVLSEVIPVFVSVDPDRDTIEVLSQYAPAFHPNMVGLTGSKEQVKAAKKAYRVYSAKEKTEEGADPDAYLVSHTSYTYLMDRNGEYVTHFKTQTDPQVMAKRLQEIVGQ